MKSVLRSYMMSLFNKGLYIGKIPFYYIAANHGFICSMEAGVRFTIAIVDLIDKSTYIS
jgi:hypothetical protein